MRKRRVIIFGRDLGTSSVVGAFFDARGYESVFFRDTQVCPVSRNDRCPRSPCCCDIAVVLHGLPSLNAPELLAEQQRGGCGLAASNKAVIAKSLDARERTLLAELGSPVFTYPIDLDGLASWVTECEPRMDLDHPVATRRREERVAGVDERLSLQVRGVMVEEVALVNKSDCGLCFRTSRLFLPNQLLKVRGNRAGESEDAVVRWIRPADPGSYLVGLSYCA